MASKVVGGFQWLADDATGDPVGLRRASDGREFSLSSLVSAMLFYGRGAGICKPGNGSIGNDGAYTAGGNYHRTYTRGFWMWLPANALYAGSPEDRWWTVMSTLSVGTVYNHKLSDFETQTGYKGPPRIVNPTPFVGTVGVGNFTVPTGTDIRLLRVTIPGGAFGPNGYADLMSYFALSNNTNTKTIKHLYGGSALKSIGPSFTSNVGAAIPTKIHWMDSVLNQYSFADGSGTDLAGGGGNNHYESIDTQAPQNFDVVVQTAVATDYVIWDHGYGFTRSFL